MLSCQMWFTLQISEQNAWLFIPQPGSKPSNQEAIVCWVAPLMNMPNNLLPKMSASWVGATCCSRTMALGANNGFTLF